MAGVVMASALSRASSCPEGPCGDEDFSFMNLLQLRADSRNAAQPHSNHNSIKKIHPYYHTSEEIRNEAQLLAKGCGGAMTIETVAEGGVNIDVVHVLPPNATSAPVNRVFLLFGEHSRELISPESGLRFLQVVCGKASHNSKVDVATLLRDNEFKIVLNGNPTSRTRVESGEFCLRTNPNGVDLNRNWDEMWHEETEGGGSTNPGPRPFSEPETRIFKKLVEEFQPTTFLTVHSGTRGMYMPWAYDMEHTANYNAPLMLNVLKDLDESHCQCPFGAAGREVGYPCPGTCLDWVYSKLKTPYVFAFEIYTSHDRDSELKERWKDKLKSGGSQLLQTGNHLGHRHFSDLFQEHTSDFVQMRTNRSANEDEECFGMFNPETEEDYNKVVENWADSYLEMADMIVQQIKKDDKILSRMPAKRKRS